MITFGKKDWNVESLLRKSGVLNLSTKYNYYFYGLKQEENPPVLFTYRNPFRRTDSAEVVPDAYYEMLSYFGFVNVFLTKNHFTFSYTTEHNPDIDFLTMKIGLRRDLRGMPEICIPLIKTIVLGMEGKINMDKKYVYKTQIPQLMQASSHLI